MEAAAIPKAASRTARGRVQLVYISSATRPTQADLDRIAERSRERNARWGITGILIHQGDQFCGVLEGPQDLVFALMEIIITDPHHRQLRVLREGAVDAPRFDNWSFTQLPAEPGRPAMQQTAARFILDLARLLR